jgi:flagellar protein FliS
MFATLNNPMAAYGKVGTDMRVETADPHKLILMLFDGAKMTLASATLHYRQGNLTEMSRNIARTTDIIANGLKASLDYRSGGELAERLAALYDYMCARLQTANLHPNPAIFEEVGGLLADLNGAWEEIAENPGVRPLNRNAA